MATRAGGKRAVADINVTPLVDVVLVLLIIFMVLTPLVEKQLYVRVPERADAVEADQEPAPVILRVKGDGHVLLNRNDVLIDEAMRTVQAMFDGRPSRVLFLDAEDDVAYDQVVQVADRIRQAGVNTIGLMTDTVSLP